MRNCSGRVLNANLMHITNFIWISRVKFYLFIYFIHLFRLQACWERHAPIPAFGSQYFWLSGVEPKAVYFSKWRSSISFLVDHTVCNKEGEIILCDINVLQGKKMQVCNGMLLGQSGVFATESSQGKVGEIWFLTQADDEQVLFLPLDKTLPKELCLHQKLHCNSVKSAVCVNFKGCSSTNICGAKRD